MAPIQHTTTSWKVRKLLVGTPLHHNLPHSKPLHLDLFVFLICKAIGWNTPLVLTSKAVQWLKTSPTRLLADTPLHLSHYSIYNLFMGIPLESYWPWRWGNPGCSFCGKNHCMPTKESIPGTPFCTIVNHGGSLHHVMSNIMSDIMSHHVTGLAHQLSLFEQVILTCDNVYSVVTLWSY